LIIVNVGIHVDMWECTEGTGISWAKVNATTIPEITGLKHHATPS